MHIGDSYYFYFKDFQKAIDDYTKALKLSSQNSFILGARAKVYLKLKQYDKALTDVNQALKYDGLAPDLLRLRGKIYYETNKENKAFQDYIDSLIYGNSSNIAHTYLGYIYYLKKNYALASEELIKADAIDDGDAQDWYYITASQWHDRDCKFVKSAYKYKAKCDKERSCKQENLEWAIKSAEFAKANGVCK